MSHEHSAPKVGLCEDVWKRRCMIEVETIDGRCQHTFSVGVYFFEEHGQERGDTVTTIYHKKGLIHVERYE